MREDVLLHGVCEASAGDGDSLGLRSAHNTVEHSRPRLRGPHDGPAPPGDELEEGRDEFPWEDITPLGKPWLYLLQRLYPDVSGMVLFNRG